MAAICVPGTWAVSAPRTPLRKCRNCRCIYHASWPANAGAFNACIPAALGPWQVAHCAANKDCPLVKSGVAESLVSETGAVGLEQPTMPMQNAKMRYFMEDEVTDYLANKRWHSEMDCMHSEADTCYSETDRWHSGATT